MTARSCWRKATLSKKYYQECLSFRGLVDRRALLYELSAFTLKCTEAVCEVLTAQTHCRGTPTPALGYFLS